MTQAAFNHSAAPETEVMRRCIQDCLDCAQACRDAVHQCLERGGPSSAPYHVNLMMDCAEISQTAADFMTRMSPRHRHTCNVCAIIAAECAYDCERIANGDPTMIICADACRTCADSCKTMSQDGDQHP